MAAPDRPPCSVGSDIPARQITRMKFRNKYTAQIEKKKWRHVTEEKSVNRGRVTPDQLNGNYWVTPVSRKRCYSAARLHYYL